MNLFVTGTDTEVGKTVVSCCLVAGLRQHQAQVYGIKPFASGGPPPGEDALRLAEAAGHTPMVYQCFPEPASPERAALQCGQRVDVKGALGWVQALPSPLVVEGVGGWEVPLDAQQTMADFAQALGFGVVVVAANKLGVLNHTLLTVGAIRQRGLEVKGVVLNTYGPTSPLHDWNQADLQNRGVPVVKMGPVTPGDWPTVGADLVERLGLLQ